MILVFFLLLAAIGGATYYFYMELEDVRDDVNTLENQLNDDQHIAELREAEELRERVAEAEIQLEQMEKSHQRLGASIVIDNSLINEISLAKPNNVALEMISFTGRSVNLQGSGGQQRHLSPFST